MKAFDIHNTPDTFDAFIISVKKLIEETEVEVDDWYPDALFTVDEYDLGRIIDIDEEVAELEIPHQAILETKCVQHIMKDKVKWYAHVSVVGDDDGKKYLVLVIGSFTQTGMWISEIIQHEGYEYVKQWDGLAPSEHFPKIVIPLRRAIVNRG